VKCLSEQLCLPLSKSYSFCELLDVVPSPFPAGYKAKKDYSIIKAPLAQFMTWNPLNSPVKQMHVFWGASGPVFVSLGISVGKTAFKGEPYNQRGSGNMKYIASS